MSKSVDNIVFGSDPTQYWLSAASADTAITAAVASSYSFGNEGVHIADDFVDILLPSAFAWTPGGPYAQNFITSAECAVSQVLPSAMALPVYQISNNAYQVVSAASLVSYSHNSFNGKSECNVSIFGSLAQTATVTQTPQDEYWLVPFRFSIYSHLNYTYTYQLWHNDTNNKNLRDANGNEIGVTNHEFGHPFWCMSLCTLLPGSFLPEAGLINTPIYLDGTNFTYQLNTPLLTGFANALHVDNIDNCDFVQFVDKIKNLPNCDILYGIIYKSGEHDRSKRVHWDRAPGTIYGVGGLMSANIASATKIDDDHGKVDGLRTSQVLNRAFINPTTDPVSYSAAETTDCLYDKYEFYCRMPKSQYPTTTSAINALQNAINSYTYIEVSAIDGFFSRDQTSTIVPSTALVFNMSEQSTWSQLRTCVTISCCVAYSAWKK